MVKLFDSERGMLAVIGITLATILLVVDSVVSPINPTALTAFVSAALGGYLWFYRDKGVEAKTKM